MATEKKLSFYIEEEERKIEKCKERIKQYKADIEVLKQPNVLCVGDRVRLKRSYNTEADYKNSSGWRAYLHFMHPENIATIKTVECWEGKLGYYLKFDDQTCYYSFPNPEGSQTYEAGAIFYFPANAIVPVDKKRLCVRLRFNKCEWHELELVAIKDEYIELLDELKKARVISEYSVHEIEETENEN